MMNNESFKIPKKGAVQNACKLFKELIKPVIPSDRLVRIVEESTFEYEKQIEEEAPTDKAAKPHTPEVIG